MTIYTEDYFVWDPVIGEQSVEKRTAVLIEERPGFALLIPGLRYHQAEGRAIQFGFSGVLIDGRRFPIPMILWYRSLN